MRGTPPPSDSAAATIPPSSLRVLRRLPEPDVATPPPPAGLEPPVELELDAEIEPEPKLESDPDPLLKFATQPLLHLSPEERQDLRMRRSVQLLEQIAQNTKSGSTSSSAQLRLLEGWQTSATDGATALIYVGQQSCAGLARMVVTHPKFPAAVGTLLGSGSLATLFWSYIAPWLWP